MTRSTFNFVIDSISFLDLIGMMVTGIIMKYILPPGTGGLERQISGGRGRAHIKELLGMTRHEWGSIHTYLAIIFIILMVVHIIIHWAWIKSYIKGFFKTARQYDTI
jgi:hypothetical protein